MLAVKDMAAALPSLVKHAHSFANSHTQAADSLSRLTAIVQSCKITKALLRHVSSTFTRDLEIFSQRASSRKCDEECTILFNENPTSLLCNLQYSFNWPIIIQNNNSLAERHQELAADCNCPISLTSFHINGKMRTHLFKSLTRLWNPETSKLFVESKAGQIT